MLLLEIQTLLFETQILLFEIQTLLLMIQTLLLEVKTLFHKEIASSQFGLIPSSKNAEGTVRQCHTTILCQEK